MSVDKKRTSIFLLASLILLIALTTGAMSFFVVSMGNESQRVINDVGTIYMQGMSEEISTHFETTIGFRMDPLKSIIKNNPPERFLDNSEQREKLRYEGVIRSYDYMAFLDADGVFHMIYGDNVVLEAPDPFMESVLAGNERIAVGHSVNEDKIVMLAVPAEYHLKDGTTSIALAAGIPAQYINDILSLNESKGLTYSHIIRRNGSFIICNSKAPADDNYFSMISNLYYGDDDQDEVFIKELQNAMAASRDFSSVISAENERRHVYCSPLAHSDWYLLTVMPYGVLDETINRLDDRRIFLFIITVCVVIVLMCAVFFLYFRMSQKQMRLIDQARKEAEKANKAKSEFLSNMSHDIRTPMNAIVGMTTIALSHLDNQQQVENCLNKIGLSSKHLLGLINDILDMSKIESGKMTLTMTEVSLREVMDSVVSISQPQVKYKKQQFDVFIEQIEYEHVYCDSLRLNQILLNLLSNAIKFTPEEGKIEVRLSESESERGDNFTRVHFTVKDNGIGIKEEFQQNVFKAFTREDSKRVCKTEGTGLGMAITKYIVDAMNGTIELKSAPGKGTQFDVILDLEKAVVPDEEMMLPNWHMLVVDDDELICTTTVDSLAKIGIASDWTLDGESALKMVVGQSDKGTPYDIILLDWKLPGMDGIETAREIRRRFGNDIPILLISAYDWTDIEEEAVKAGINEFISKPLFRSTLYYGLKRFVDDIDGHKVLTNPKEEEPKIDHIGGKAHFDNVKILLAEDNDLNWEIAEELLSGLGLDIDRAENGQICVDMFENSEEGYYKAILMDIRMPVMSGYEAAEIIRKGTRGDCGLPIIAMTADAFSDDVKRCMDAGMNAHIPKPINIDEVARLLNKFINNQ